MIHVARVEIGMSTGNFVGLPPESLALSPDHLLFGWEPARARRFRAIAHETDYATSHLSPARGSRERAIVRRACRNEALSLVQELALYFRSWHWL